MLGSRKNSEHRGGITACCSLRNTPLGHFVEHVARAQRWQRGSRGRGRGCRNSGAASWRSCCCNFWRRQGEAAGGWRPWEEALCWKNSGRHGWEQGLGLHAACAHGGCCCAVERRVGRREEGGVGWGKKRALLLGAMGEGAELPACCTPCIAGRGRRHGWSRGTRAHGEEELGY
jgi:hypothetical protein